MVFRSGKIPVSILFPDQELFPPQRISVTLRADFSLSKKLFLCFIYLFQGMFDKTPERESTSEREDERRDCGEVIDIEYIWYYRITLNLTHMDIFDF